jgi:hypothetical protein
MGRTLIVASGLVVLVIAIGSSAAAGSRRLASKGLLPPPPPMAHRLVEALDTDRDGELSAEEIQGSSAALLALDEDGDGTLSHEEWTLPPLPGGPHPPPHRCGQSIGQNPPPPRGPMHLDMDDDEAISLEEFLAPAVDAFSRFDSNGDGFIDKEEAAMMPPPPPGRRPHA